MSQSSATATIRTGQSRSYRRWLREVARLTDVSGVELCGVRRRAAVFRAVRPVTFAVAA